MQAKSKLWHGMNHLFYIDTRTVKNAREYRHLLLLKQMNDKEYAWKF